VHAAGRALEERRADVLLDLADAAAERGLRQVQLPRGAAKAAEARDGDEGLQFRDVAGPASREWRPSELCIGLIIATRLF
jgi:hypothetical protein